MMVVNNDLSDIEKSYMFDSPVSTDHSTPGQKDKEEISFLFILKIKYLKRKYPTTTTTTRK